MFVEDHCAELNTITGFVFVEDPLADKFLILVEDPWAELRMYHNVLAACSGF